MANSSKKRRISRQYYTFFFSCLASLLGLAFYLFCAKIIPFPKQWFPNSLGKDEKFFLFFSGISVHLQVNTVLWIIFTLINTEKMDRIKVKRWRFWIGKILIFVFSLGAGYKNFWEGVKNNLGSIFLLILIITVINCCLLELLIQLMNQYGICNGFNLILFTEFVPFGWLIKNWNSVYLLLLFILTVLFIWITNLKWEIPVETNSLYSQDSKLLKKNRTKFSLRMSFSFMPLYHLSSFISYINTFIMMKNIGVNWFNLNSLTSTYEEVEKQKARSTVNEKSFWQSFVSLADSSTPESKHIFKKDNIKNWFGGWKWKIVSALVLLLCLRWLVVWLQMRKSQWKTEEISKYLRSRGIYANRLSPGHSTRVLLKKIINKLVLFWSVIVLVFNIVFDVIFSATQTLFFTSWFGGVNIGIDLIRQIRTKYKYIKTK